MNLLVWRFLWLVVFGVLWFWYFDFFCLLGLEFVEFDVFWVFGFCDDLCFWVWVGWLLL